jgi:two-component system sensor histidine kinase BaeS
VSGPAWPESPYGRRGGGRGRPNRHPFDPNDERRRWHWRRGRYDRPPWWPDNEPWPPQGEFPWRRMRRLFLIRFAVGVLFVISLVLAGPIIAISVLVGATGLAEPLSAVFVAALLLLVALGIAGTARSARRFALPFGELIEAAGRLEGGDYSARVHDFGHGPRELRALVAAFNAMAAQLETDEEQRRTLLADVSHELRTPLAVLRGELEAMIDGIHPADEEHLSAAVDEIAMLTGLVEDLRTFAQAESGRLELHPETTDLGVLIQEVATSFEPLAAKGAVRLDVQLPAELPLASIDPLRVRQVLSNVVANALRYAPSGSEVRIAAAQVAPDRISISVRDHGPGISPEVLPHLFDRFARGSDSRGSGLGLAIARRLVEAHGGIIRADQPADGGTLIGFELPLGEAA